MSTYVVEKDVPITPSAREGNKESKYPFSSMEINDSFAVPLEDGLTVKKLARRLYGATANATKATGRKFTVRSYSDGLRVWRVE